MKMYVEAEQVSLFGQGSWCSKMSRDCGVPTAERTSRQSSKKPSASSARKRPLFLCLRADGRTPDASLEWATAESPFPSPGDYTTRSFGESPREENASRLSQILEDFQRQKSYLSEEDYQRHMSRYYLSAKACQGILNRAERARNRNTMPEELLTALREQSAST